MEFVRILMHPAMYDLFESKGVNLTGFIRGESRIPILKPEATATTEGVRRVLVRLRAEKSGK